MESDKQGGRARGRARGNTGVSSSDERRRPGEAPKDVQLALLGRGGRGAMEAARGVSPQGRGIQPVQAAGRATRAAVAEPRVSLAQGMGAMSLSSSGSDISGSGNGSGSGPTAGSNGNGDGGSGDAQTTSVARGAKRGRPTESMILRTIPSNLPSKKGTEGSGIKLKANFFALKKLPNWRLYQYRVDMKPEVDYTKERKYHVKQNQSLSNFFFDGTMLITNRPITQNKDTHLVFSSKRSSDDQIIEVTIRLVGEVDPSSSTYIQFLNIIMRSLLEKLNLDLIGRDYFDSKAAIQDQNLRRHKLELYPGYQTSIRQHENEVLLGVEISHKVLRVDCVLDVIREIANRTRNRANLQADLDKALLGQIVITKYNNKTYKICEVRMDMSPSDEFEDKKGNKVKYQDYYLKRWGMKITDSKQPLIISLPKDRDIRGNKPLPTNLVPELCNMTGLSDAQRADFRLMQDVAVYTRQDPAMKTKALLNFAERINGTKEVKEILDKWDMEFSTSLVDVPARQLPPEQIEGGQGCSTTYQISNADWGNAFRNWKCRASADLKKWVIITPERDEKNTSELVNCLTKIFPGIGMNVAKPKVAVIQDSKMNNYRGALEEWTAKRPELIVVVLPNVNEDLYAMVKKHCLVKSPVPSQVVTGRVLSKPKGLMSVATKIALQINCKLGGQLWAVNIPLKGAMMVGYDSYHDSQQKGKSVGALVASLNKEATKYFSTCEYHDSNGATEITDKIALMMSQALKAYQTTNNELPSRIFFFRDGVGDGQIPYVAATEIQAVKKAIDMFNDAIKITVIITSKRINARFLASAGNRAVNPNSGTVVDDIVTLPERYDYFIVSQSVRQGTVNPTSYNVIHDECGLPPGKMQILTYKLTHLYFNWPGTVRVPAPVQYAHKLAYLVGTSVHTKPDDKMDQVLFYL